MVGYDTSMLVGRAREFALLSDCLAAAAKGKCEIAVVSGEAGIGKTHLTREVMSRANDLGFEVLLGRCFANDGRAAFAPWREALAPYDGRIERFLANAKLTA